MYVFSYMETNKQLYERTYSKWLRITISGNRLVEFPLSHLVVRRSWQTK